MTNSISVNKQFLSDMFGSTYEMRYNHKQHSYSIIEDFREEDDDSYTTAEAAYQDLVKRIKQDSIDTVNHFEREMQKTKNKWLFFRYSYGWLPAKRFETMTRTLDHVEYCRQVETNIPSLNYILKPLDDEFLIAENFIRPDQTCYVFVKAHSIHFESAVYETQGANVTISAMSKDNQAVPQVFMYVQLKSLDGKQEFTIHWSDFLSFNDDYYTTGTYGQYVFTDKEKCLSFAREMMKKDIEKLQHNMDSLSF
jgi:hypothetical protein